MNFTTKMFSGDLELSARKFWGNESASRYTPEFRMRFAAARAAWHASTPPLTSTPEQELYAVALIPPAPAPSLVKTPAFTYMLARIASAPLLVKRPLSPAA